MGVRFEGERPEPMDVNWGYYGVGGWHGNARAMENYLIGKDATETTSLVDWSEPRYANAINEENQFGIDVRSGTTRTAQNSFDGISGATVRISREATSYQRALVAAGIIYESDVIIGRFLLLLHLDSWSVAERKPGFFVKVKDGENFNAGIPDVF